MPAGWYADPAPPNPAFPTTMRYWDGAAWTAQTRGASRKELAASREAAYVAQAQAAAAHAEHVALLQEQGIYEPGPMAASSRDYTPDGQLLARWGRRFSAQLIDWVITCVIAAVVGWSFVSKISSAWSGYVQDSLDAARTGVPAPDASALSSSIAGPAASFGLVYLAVLFLYGVLFLKLFAATPGKMAVGTQVPARVADGPRALVRPEPRGAGAAGPAPRAGVLGVLPARRALAAVGPAPPGPARQGRPHERRPALTVICDAGSAGGARRPARAERPGVRLT
jgi:uncharacterized RDD family membrane protein YckC